MKKFLIEIILFSAVLCLATGSVFFLADGKSDSYYVRFTTPRQHSLVIGTSRAAQGIQPAILDEIIYRDRAQHFFNYSFSLFDSPYGYAYFESIKNKLDPETRDGIFIVTVDPWSLSSSTEDPNDSDNFIENNSFITKTRYVNLNPNIPYLVNSYNEPYFTIIKKWAKPADMNLRKDGWLDIDVSMDSAEVATRLENKIRDYRKNYLPIYRFSAVRMNYLSKTISFLQSHGKVYLVGMPVHQKMFEIEKELMPDFDEKINSIIEELNVPYLNLQFMADNYQYVDGGHLYKVSGKEVTRKIANWIVNNK